MEKRFTSSWCYPNALGLCGDFIDNRTEATATVLLIVAWRLNYVAYLKTPIFAHVRFIYKMPNLSMTDNIFELPFNTNVWACTFALVVLSGGLFAGARAVGKRKYREHLELIDSAFNVIPIAAQQGSIIEAKGIGLRTFILVTLIGLMALEVSFSAKIISLIQAPSRRINTLKDLLESKLEVAADDTVYNRHFLSVSGRFSVLIIESSFSFSEFSLPDSYGTSPSGAIRKEALIEKWIDERVWNGRWYCKGARGTIPFADIPVKDYHFHFLFHYCAGPFCISPLRFHRLQEGEWDFRRSWKVLPEGNEACAH